MKRSETSTLPRTTDPRSVDITIDTANMYADQVGREGITQQELAALTEVLQPIHVRIRAQAQQGLEAEYACLNLAPAMTAQLAEIEQAAAALKRFRDVVLIGIGGSSLGAKAVWHTLTGGTVGTMDATRLHFVENVDPDDLTLLQSKLDPATTGVICISKSGSTLETIVQYLLFRQWLTRALGKPEAGKRQWVITDPQGGWLRELVQRERLASLPVPPKVGGRYSVLSAVGLLPLAAGGIDIRALLQGAVAQAGRSQTDDVHANPALELAALSFLLDTRKHKRVSIMMPYANRLALFVDWFRQLWAESLGKKRTGQEPAGTLPVGALGTVDQHSQLQMYLESRHDKTFTFLTLDRWRSDCPIPLEDAERTTFPYLQGRTLAEIMAAEFLATRRSITDAGHPNMTIRLPQLDAYTLGQLIDLYERTTVYTGLLYGINPLDQPAVEKGKKLAIQYLSEQS